MSEPHPSDHGSIFHRTWMVTRTEMAEFVGNFGKVAQTPITTAVEQAIDFGGVVKLTRMKWAPRGSGGALVMALLYVLYSRGVQQIYAAP